MKHAPTARFASAFAAALCLAGCAVDSTSEPFEELDMESSAEALPTPPPVRYHCATTNKAAAVPRFQMALGKINKAMRAEYTSLVAGRASSSSELFRDTAFRSPRGAAGSLKYQGPALSALYAPNSAWVVVDASMAKRQPSGKALVYSAVGTQATPYSYNCAQIPGGFSSLK